MQKHTPPNGYGLRLEDECKQCRGGVSGKLTSVTAYLLIAFIFGAGFCAAAVNGWFGWLAKRLCKEIHSFETVTPILSRQARARP